MVVEIVEVTDQTTSSADAGKHANTRIFKVELDAPTAGGAAIARSAYLSASKHIPPDGDPHPSGDGTVVVRRVANAISGSQTLFQVDVDYDDPGLGGQTDPLLAPAQIIYGAIETTEDYFLDCSDTPKPVVNSAGEPFDQNPQREKSILTITVITNESGFNPVAMSALADTTNSGTVTIDGISYAAGTLKLGAITAVKRQSAAGTAYYEVTKPLKASHEGWDQKIDDYGYSEAVTFGDAIWRSRIRGPNMEYITKPWPLDGSGSKKAEPTDTPAKITFKPYKANAWTGLKWT